MSLKKLHMIKAEQEAATISQCYEIAETLHKEACMLVKAGHPLRFLVIHLLAQKLMGNSLSDDAVESIFDSIDATA